MMNIIFFILAVAVSILLGINIGNRRGYINGWLSGNESANKYWESRVPKEIRDKINNEKYNKLLDIIFDNLSEKEVRKE